MVQGNTDDGFKALLKIIGVVILAIAVLIAVVLVVLGVLVGKAC